MFEPHTYQRHLIDDRTCEAVWVDSLRSDSGLREACPAAVTRQLSISNLVMSSVPSQPERLTGNLCSVLLANNLGNTCQEQRRMVVFPFLPNTLQIFREQTCSFCSKPGHSCTSWGELSPLATAELPLMLVVSPEAGGRGNADFSSQRCMLFSQQAFSI